MMSIHDIQTIIDQHPFDPPFLIRNAKIQTALASGKLRLPKHSAMEAVEKEIILEVDGGIKLQGFMSSHNPQADGMVILFHGWEGSARSTYVRCTGDAFFNHNFDVFRLNFRDHGDTHHLNREPFRSDRLEEVFQAVKQIAETKPDLPKFLVGFSLGGNFALRVAHRAAMDSVSGLQLVAAVSPVLNPEKSTEAIDSIPWMLNYFLKKWFRSMRKKDACFPGDNDYEGAFKLKSCMTITDYLIQQQPGYSSVLDYFKTYTLTPDFFQTLGMPTLVITAEDDPAIPVSDFRILPETDNLVCRIEPHGGHCGFIENFRLQSWLNHLLPWLCHCAT